jgi:hypothetical protein
MRKILLLLLILPLVGCLATTATQNMTKQTSDPVLLGKAAYYDALTLYNNTAEIYLRYRPILQTENPDANALVKAKLQEMKATLDKWRDLSDLLKLGEIEAGSPEFQDTRRQILFSMAKYLEGGE